MSMTTSYEQEGIVMNYVVEHMEDDEIDSDVTIPAWVQLEYKHMRTLAGPSACVLFTNLSAQSANSLNAIMANMHGDSLASWDCHTCGILDLIKTAPYDIGIDKICLLDPKAKQPLSPQDGDGRFQWFLFGGILGDDPPRDRTAELRVLGFPSRHLGPVHMTTDTALGVTKKVVQDKVPLDAIPYTDFPTITFSPQESVEMPFRYMTNGKEPLLPPGMKQLLHDDLDKSFDF